MNEKKEKQKLIKITREQIITKSGVYFILISVFLIASMAFFFLIMGGFSEFFTGVGGNKSAIAIKAGIRIVFFVGMIIVCAVFYFIAYEVKAKEKETMTRPSIYKTGAKKFWRWLWSDIRRSKR